MSSSFSPTSKIVIFSQRFTIADLLSLAEIHIRGCLLWGECTEEMLPCTLATILTAPVFLGSESVASAFITACRDPLHPCERYPKIGERKRAVLQRLANGEERPEIAQAEAICPKTVDRIIADLKAVLEVTNLVALGAKARTLGIIRAE